jgi:F-type H+-transporting ATPase subunit delta
MSSSAVALNYAEALFELARKSGQLEEFGRLLDATTLAIDSSPAVQSVLMNPKVTKATKADILARAVAGIGAPRPFALYLAAVVKRGRQNALRAIAAAYHELLDAHLGRVRAHVTVARAPDDELAAALAASLSKNLGKQVVPSFTVDPEILGGAIVRLGDRVHDGSLRRRLLRLRRHLLNR